MRELSDKNKSIIMACVCVALVIAIGITVVFLINSLDGNHALENKKELVKKLGFLPKENTCGIYEKIYAKGGCSIRVDFNKKIIDYGELINCESKTTQNFSKEENLSVGRIV